MKEISHITGDMTGLNPEEIAALASQIQAVDAMLVELGKTDLTTELPPAVFGNTQKGLKGVVRTKLPEALKIK